MHLRLASNLQIYIFKFVVKFRKSSGHDLVGISQVNLRVLTNFSLTKKT